VSKNVTSEQIRERIDGFVQELQRLVRRNALEALEGVLAGDGVPSRGKRGPGRPRKGAANDALNARVLDHVQANDGLTVSQIGQAVGAGAKALRKVMLGLMEAGRLHTSGQRRGTRYHAGAGRGRRNKPRSKA